MYSDYEERVAHEEATFGPSFFTPQYLSRGDSYLYFKGYLGYSNIHKSSGVFRVLLVSSPCPNCFLQNCTMAVVLFPVADAQSLVVFIAKFALEKRASSHPPEVFVLILFVSGAIRELFCRAGCQK